MPFKPGKSPSDVSRKIKRILEQELPVNIEKGLFSMYTILSGTADYYVPVDTSALVQSRTYRIRNDGGNWTMTYGYYTEYASALHNPKPGGKMDGWKPMDPYTREWNTMSAKNFVGGGTGGYNPNAKQGWMNIAWDEAGEEAINAFGRMIEP